MAGTVTISGADTGSFGGRMRDARERRGLSLRKAAERLHRRLAHGSYDVSDDWIRRVEVGDIGEAEVDPVIVAALAAEYGRPVAELSELVADGLNEVVLVLSAAQVKPPRSDDGGVTAG